MLNTLLATVALLVAAIYGYGIAQLPAIAISDPLGPRAFPILLAVALVFTAGLLLAEGRKNRDWQGGIKTLASSLRTDAKIVVPAALWLALYFIAFEPLGYLLSTAIFLLGMMTAVHNGRHSTSIIVALGFAIVSYALFAGVFAAPLPRGILPI